jgi:hypothetical protein
MVPKNFLESYRGMLQTDRYVSYDIYEKKDGITLFGCMAHARRKFEKTKDNDLKRAEYVLDSATMPRTDKVSPPSLIAFTTSPVVIFISFACYLSNS